MQGKCSMNLTKFYFNIVTKECELFAYTGCGGNANNFMSILECETRCKQGYGVIAQIKISKPSGPSSDVAKKPETAFVPIILNETSRVTGNESIPIEPAAVPGILDASSKQKPIELPAKQEARPQEATADQSAIKVIPYHGEHLTIPFKQEVAEHNLPQVNQTNIDAQSFGEKVLQDIAAQKGTKYPVKAETQKINALPQQQVAPQQQQQLPQQQKMPQNQMLPQLAAPQQQQLPAQQPAPQQQQLSQQPQPQQLAPQQQQQNRTNPQLTSNETAVVPGSFLKISFNIINAWSPKMTDPTFPPRVKIVNQLNDAVSHSCFLLSSFSFGNHFLKTQLFAYSN